MEAAVPEGGCSPEPVEGPLDIQSIDIPGGGPAPPDGILQVIHQSEHRILERVDSIVTSFNAVLKEGLGEVQAKFAVELCAWVLEFDPMRKGKKFPSNLLNTNFDLDLFQTTMFEFRGLDKKTAQNTCRDVKRFIGCFDFPDAAGADMPNLVVSIFKRGLLRLLISSKLWKAC